VALLVDASLVDGDRDAHRLRYGGLDRYDRECEVDEGREEKDHRTPFNLAQCSAQDR
jgi:hypothetical protein